MVRYMIRLCALLMAMSQGALSQPRTEEPFRIGMVVAASDVPEIEGVSGIREMFSRALGRSVEVIAARDHEALVAAHVAGRVDYAIYTALSYAAAARCGCVEPIATPMTSEGAIGVRSILMTRTERALERIAVGAPDSVAGRLAPLALWPDAFEARSAQRLVDFPSAQDAQEEFVAGAVDAIFGWVPVSSSGENLPGGTPDRLAAMSSAGTESRIEWESDVLRHGPHAVRADLSRDMRQKLVAMLVDGTDAELVYINRAYGGGFVAASRDDYQPAVKILESLEAE